VDTTQDENLGIPPEIFVANTSVKPREEHHHHQALPIGTSVIKGIFMLTA
jgi:hypothetical protein